MLAAMVAGDRTYLTHSLRVGFERTGSFHMLVVSGFHLAIVAGFHLLAGAAVARLPRVPATLLTIFVSFAYAIFTGFATPVQRSLWMVTLYLLGRLVYRERSPLNIIGFASLCLLVASPRSLFDSSLQMTLLAVVAIAGVAAPLLQGTVHPYLNAARELRLTAIDAKLEPRLAQFRGHNCGWLPRRLQELSVGALEWSLAGGYFRGACGLRSAGCRVGGRFVRGGTGDDAADGDLFPSDHAVCVAGESVHFAAAGGADAGGTGDCAVAFCVARGGGGSGDGCGACAACGVGLVRLFGSLAMETSDSRSAALAIGGFLRVACAGDCAGSPERG